METRSPSFPQPERLYLLDGLRGIAALFVLFFHAGSINLTPLLASRGYLFVDFFFLLSGFVLTNAVEPKLARGMTPGSFLLRRFWRLWPVMMVGVLIAIIVLVQRGEFVHSLPLVAMALLLIPRLGHDGEIFPFNGPQWSLLFELIANAVHALVLIRLNRIGLIAIILISGTILAAGVLHFGSNEFGMRGELWLLGFPRVLFSYGLGVLLARDRLSNPWLGRLRSHWFTVVALPVLVIFTLPFWPVGRAIGDIVVTFLVLPTCFACAINAELPERLVPVFSGLSLLSYPLYAVHLPILTLAQLNLAPEVSPWIGPAAAIYFAAVVARLLEMRPKQPSGLTKVRAAIGIFRKKRPS